MYTAAPSAMPGSALPQVNSAASIIRAAIAGAILVGLSIVVAFFILPRFHEVYQDFDTQLPWLTMILLKHPILLPLFALLISLATMVNEALMPRFAAPPVLRWSLRALLLLVLVACFFIVLAALLLPMVGLFTVAP